MSGDATHKVSHKWAYVLGIVTCLVCFAYYKTPYYTAFSMGVFVMLGARFMKELGSGFPIREVIALMAVLQWLLAPIFTYAYSQDDVIYYMPIVEKVYFAYAFPATMAYVVGLFAFSKVSNRKVFTKEYLEEFCRDKPYMPGILIVISLIVSVARILHLIPPSLNFFVFIVSGFLYVGLFYNMFSQSKWKRSLMVLVMGGLLFSSISEGMFHEFILWMIFFIMVFSIYRPSRMLFKIAILFCFVMVGFIIQSIKAPYRILTWEENIELTPAERNTLFLNIAKERLADPISIFDIDNIAYSVIRVNSGWVVSRIMYNTPSRTPYAQGETIRNAIAAVMLPRFLAPEKVKGGGRENYLRFTGMKLNEDTSINISQLGEAYANFGELGGMITMLIYGLFINLVLNKIFSIANTNPGLIFWIPLMFLQGIKAEIDFMIPLNHLVKSVFVIFVFFQLLKRWEQSRKNRAEHRLPPAVTNLHNDFELK